MPLTRRRTPDRIKVKIPLKVSWPPTLPVDERYGPNDWERNDYPLSDLPESAKEPFLRLVGVPDFVKERGTHPDVPGDPNGYPDFAQSSSRVHACDECGYLTMADALKATSFRDYECGNCGNAVEHQSFGSKGGFTKVWPPDSVIDEDNLVDIRTVDPSDVPNHPSHLGRIKNKAGASRSGGQMIKEVTEALEEFYETR